MSTSPKKQKTVSAGAIFKQQHRKNKKSTTPFAVNIGKRIVEDALDGKTPSPKSGSSSRTPQKASGKVSGKRSEQHPLAVEFKGKLIPRTHIRTSADTNVETTNDYRRHVYKATTLKINKTLEVLLHTLYESTLQPISSDNELQDLPHSPLRLSIPAKFQLEALKLYQPLSAYNVYLKHTKASGERIEIKASLEQRMLDYGDYLAEQQNEIEELQKDWETVVGEIWKLGGAVLGEGLMESSLFTNKGALDHSSLLSKATDAESTLFVPEHDGSPPVAHKSRSKKRVTFEEPEDVSTTPAPLEFLYRPSEYTPVAVVPALSERDVDDVAKDVEGLGKVHISKLRQYEKEYRTYWEKKKARIASVICEDVDEDEED
jgi:hypothetical protein